MARSLRSVSLTSQAPRRATLLPRRASARFAFAALCGFVMFSATFALATALQPHRGAPLAGAAPGGAAMQAEAGVRASVDERLHLHLKRMHTLARSVD